MNIRKQHRYVALLIALPLIFISVTGVILLYRNQFEWIQPKSVSSTLELGKSLLSFEEISSKVGPGIDQIIYKPSKGNLAVRMKSGLEYQLHPQTGEVLKKAERRTAFLIELHQGSWLGPFGQLFIHGIAGFGLIFLIYSGFVILPFWRRKDVCKDLDLD